jgi:hypothetical protein
MEIIALISAAILGAPIWQIVSYHKRQNEEFLKNKWHYENQEANRQAEEAHRKEVERVEQMTDEELDAELDLDDDPDGDAEEARFRETVREIQEISDAANKRRW